MMVIFASLRPLERSENIQTVWNAYKGEKKFVRINYGSNKELKTNKYDLVVTDEFIPQCISPMIMIFHGIAGGKTYGLDQPRAYHRRDTVDRYLYFVTSGKNMVDFTARQCGVSSDKVLPLGMPRTDLYFQNLKRDPKFLPEDKKVYLYAPTFRTFTEKETDWLKIDSMLNSDEMLVIKNHPVMKDPHLVDDNKFKRIRIVSCSFQSIPFLIGADAIITDYSSIMFDAHVLGKPVILYEKDYDRYMESRGMSFKYPEEYSAQHTTDEEELIEMLRNPTVDPKFKKFFADACDGHATERLIELIERSLNES